MACCNTGDKVATAAIWRWAPALRRCNSLLTVPRQAPLPKVSRSARTVMAWPCAAIASIAALICSALTFAISFSRVFLVVVAGAIIFLKHDAQGQHIIQARAKRKVFLNRNY